MPFAKIDLLTRTSYKIKVVNIFTVTDTVFVPYVKQREMTEGLPNRQISVES